jgi:hypothetical protein
MAQSRRYDAFIVTYLALEWSLYRAPFQTETPSSSCCSNAMDNIYNCTIPAQVLKHKKICPLHACKAVAFSIAYSNAICISTKWQHGQQRCSLKRMRSCTRCLICSPYPCPTLRNKSILLPVLSQISGAFCTRCRVRSTGTKVM